MGGVSMRVRRAIGALVVATAATTALPSARTAQAEDCRRGDVTATTDSELAVLANATCLIGSLEIVGDVTSLKRLRNLRSIDGSISVHSTRKLTSLAGLDALERVTGSIDIGGPSGASRSCGRSTASAGSSKSGVACVLAAVTSSFPANR
jgi:hypothetical protein